MRLFALLFAGAALGGCAGDRGAVDLSSRALEKLEPWQNLAIVVRDEMGSAYRLISVMYRLDGEQIFYRSGTEELVEAARIHRGYAAPGPHLLEVVFEYQPNDSRTFTRAGYHIEVKSETRFVMLPDTPTTVETVVGGKGRVAYRIEYQEAIATR